jgi:hypothetical protein
VAYGSEDRFEVRIYTCEELLSGMGRLIYKDWF